MRDAKAVAGRFFDEVCNARNLGVADDLFTAGHVHHDPSSPTLSAGPEGMKQLVAIYQSAFPDARWNVDEMIVSGDTVVARWHGTGTHRGDLGGLAPTGKSVNVAGVWIFRIADGKVAESWDVWDTYGMMAQLGAVPSLAPVAAGA